jgi:hypothetical protein
LYGKKTKKRKITFLFDPIGNTFSFWWDDKNKEAYSNISEYSDDVMIYDKKGRVIGIEKLNFFPNEISEKIRKKALKIRSKILSIPSSEIKLLLQK